MKRNNMFMLAFILFIFISAIVRLFGEFPMWDTIIVAVTISSGFFAVADSRSTVASDLNRSIRERTRQIGDEQYKLSGMQLPGTQPTPMDVHEMNKILSDCRTQQEELYHSIETDMKDLRHYERVAGTCLMLGFLSFFCCLAFSPISRFLVPYQDMLTLLAFGVILLTQYFSTMRKSGNRSYEEQMAKLNKRWDDLEQKVKDSIQSLDDPEESPLTLPKFPVPRKDTPAPTVPMEPPAAPEVSADGPAAETAEQPAEDAPQASASSENPDQAPAAL